MVPVGIAAMLDFIISRMLGLEQVFFTGPGVLGSRALWALLRLLAKEARSWLGENLVDQGRVLKKQVMVTKTEN